MKRTELRNAFFFYVLSLFSFVQDILQLGADLISSDEPLLCVDDPADQVAEVLVFFGYA
jgi:hypothetical protein